MKRNIYKVDDNCFRFACILVVFAAICLLFFLGKPSTTLFMFLLFWSLSATILFFVGYAYRKAENRLIRLTDIIVGEGSIRLSDLSHLSGVPLDKLRKLIAEIEQYNWPLIKLEKDRVGLFIGGSVELANHCHSCGASSTHTIQLYSSMPQCPYCGAPVDGEKIAKAKQELYDRARLLCTHQASKNVLNVPLLIILFFMFWPAALIYLFIHALPKHIVAVQTSVHNKHIAPAKMHASRQTLKQQSSLRSN